MNTDMSTAILLEMLKEEEEKTRSNYERYLKNKKSKVKAKKTKEKNKI